jgi:2-dehydrotetronate isomerase
MVKFSANLGFLWPELALIERIEAAARAGFKAVELHWPYDVAPEAVRQACTRHALRLLGLNTPLGDVAKGDFGLAAVPGREADFQASFDTAVAYARDSGATAIHAMAGVVPASERDRARRVFSKNITQAADQAAQHGITVLLEAINLRDKPGYFYSTVGEVADLMSEIDRPNLRMMFDVYHVGVSEGDILTKLERHLPRIGHVQIAAVPSRAEPDEGEVAYRAVFEALDRLGYAGWVGCEYKPRGSTQDGLRWTEVLGVTL